MDQGSSMVVGEGERTNHIRSRDFFLPPTVRWKSPHHHAWHRSNQDE